MPRYLSSRLHAALASLILISSCQHPNPKEPSTAPSAPISALGAPRTTALPVTYRTVNTTNTVAESPLLSLLSSELQRNTELLKSQKTPLYYLSYQVTELETLEISAILGAVESRSRNKRRYLDIDARVGDVSFDNTHNLLEDMGFGSLFGGNPQRVEFPLEDKPEAIKTALWQKTEGRYQEAAERYERVKKTKQVRVKAEDTSNDFSLSTPDVYVEAPQQLNIDEDVWKQKLKQWSLLFIDHPEVLNSHITLSVTIENKYLVTSDGKKLQLSRSYARVSVSGESKTDDGMDLSRYEAFDAMTPETLAPEEKILAKTKEVIADLEGLRRAPLAEPFDGPAILSGRAAGVFFHEIFGHRMEGHRQKDDAEGQTFTKKLNQVIMSTILSVYDDPTLQQIAGLDLNGHYLFDDEGIRSQRVSLVEGGVLKSFLLSRNPIKNFPSSNGHGRKEPEYDVVARQGNLVVEASREVSEEELRRLLREEAKRQGKEYGLLFTDIQGGYTNTSRYGAQSFKVLPVLVYRIYTDGRPDELIRGVDLVGTPLNSLAEIVVASNRYETFNGFCGAESGYVPVSATAPSLLVRKIETEKQAKGSDLPPLLPAPPRKGGKS